MSFLSFALALVQFQLCHLFVGGTGGWNLECETGDVLVSYNCWLCKIMFFKGFKNLFFSFLFLISFMDL